MSAPSPPLRPLVLLHGWGLSASVWKPLLGHLHPQRPVHVPDLPGHGDASPAGETLASWADALLPALPDNCVLVGWSLGAHLALHLAHHRPDRIARLVLIGASPRFTACGDWPHGLPDTSLAEFRAQFDSAPEATQRRFIALQSIGDQARKAVAAALTDSLTPADAAHQAALACGLGLLAGTDLRPLASGIVQPVRLLHGSEDKLMPVAAAEWLADQLPGGRLSVFGHTGHAPFLSRSADCAALIEGFADE
ncbi:alpha/beta fold hydrolase [Zoogloea sp.]|uniref:alpha/beta fold hydrolase n=1 Tax=Zoogloea sp. TaxID=49181 RepID=UPI001416A6A3|nr:MAG: alpha/beta fold hydrolase [Zoogloea sp.]